MRILLVLSALYFKDILSQNEGEGFKFNRVPDEPKMQSPNCDYCKISHHNTFCLHRWQSSFWLIDVLTLNDFSWSHGATASSCGKILKQGVEDNLKQEILDAHNDLRGKIARGEEPELRGVTASNMMELRSHPQDSSNFKSKFNHQVGWRACPRCSAVGKPVQVETWLQWRLQVHSK